MGGEGSAHFRDGLVRSAPMRKRGPPRHARPPENRAPEDRGRRKRAEEGTNGSGKDRDAAPEELMLAVMFVVTAVGVAFVERKPRRSCSGKKNPTSPPWKTQTRRRWTASRSPLGPRELRFEVEEDPFRTPKTTPEPRRSPRRTVEDVGRGPEAPDLDN